MAARSIMEQKAKAARDFVADFNLEVNEVTRRLNEALSRWRRVEGAESVAMRFTNYLSVSLRAWRAKRISDGSARFL